MMKLMDREWKAFFIVDIFDTIQRGKRLKTADHLAGNIPYISSSALNNGVDDFISNDKDVRKFSDCLSLANSGSVGSCFYEPFEFVASDHITHLKSKGLNKYHYLFLSTMVGRLSQKYNFNREINDKRISREIILLPVTDNGEPDYAFMEEFIKEREALKRKQYLDYCKEQLKIFGGGYNLIPLSEKQWKAFYISDEKDNGIFKLRASLSGIDKNKLVECKESDIPYITRSDFNNGVTMFVGKEQKAKYKIDDGNVITIGLDTQTVFYQPHSFYTGQNIQVLYNEHLNMYVAEFIIPLLKMQVSKLSWGGNGATLGRLKRMQLLLPMSDDGNPDYDYMEKYSKNLMSRKIQSYIRYATN